jgi:hypothetical protein
MGYYFIFAASAHPSNAHTRIFRLFNTQNGALSAPRPAHRNFTDPPKEIK